MEKTTPLLQVQDLQVEVAGRTVLQSVSLQVRPGEVAVLMGANGSGKSTLGLALAGHPRYRITAGRATLGGQDLLAMGVEERARAGLFLSFQAPADIPGVKNSLFVRTAVNAVRQARGEAPQDAVDFLGEARGAARRLGLPEGMLSRPVNEGFSGGERKRNELLQLALLRPRVAILDEIDSGMDVDGVRATLELVATLRAQGTAFVVVSHYQQLIEKIEPNAVLRLEQGRISQSGGLELVREIARTGYAAAREAAEA